MLYIKILVEKCFFFIFKAQYLTILSVFLMSLFILVICHLKFFRSVERKWTINIRDDLDQIETCSIFIKSLYMLTKVYFNTGFKQQVEDEL